jgi:CBS domain-containing protein
MGEMIKNFNASEHEKKVFISHLLDDINALELMLEKGMFEDDIVRIGAEQEMCLINKNYRPSGDSLAILEKLNDNHFTTELARYNLEINLDPINLKGNCFSAVENQLIKYLNHGRNTVDEYGKKIILTGILPTIGKEHLGLDSITPLTRYLALNDIVKAHRGDDFTLKIRGTDQLELRHDSVLFEACNTSFQLHLQVPSHDFIKSYNWAQAIAGPVLGTVANSPLLLGRELWHETRIALFQQSIDTRKSSYVLKDQVSRVNFGHAWETGTVADIFKRDISHHRTMLTKPITDKSTELLKKGRIPKLEALNLNSGTIYRWNRTCYGVGGGKPHLRIENRYIPSGPSVIDEMANFAFWVGLMQARPKKYDDLPNVMEFKEAKANFIKAARTGKESVMVWEGQEIETKKLILGTMLPLAYEGLKCQGVDSNDVERLLGVVEARTKGKTGSQWMIENYRKLRKHQKRTNALLSLVKATHNNQIKNIPVHEWPNLQDKDLERPKVKWVKQLMTTRLTILHDNDYLNLAQSLMKWNNIHHIPIQNEQGTLTGLLTYSHIERLMEKGVDLQTRISEVMIKDVITTAPLTPLKEAIATMEKKQIGCLPVVVDNHLVGILSKKDIQECH